MGADRRIQRNAAVYCATEDGNKTSGVEWRGPKQCSRQRFCTGQKRGLRETNRIETRIDEKKIRMLHWMCGDPSGMQR